MSRTRSASPMWNELRFTARTASGRNLWSNRWDRPAEDFFAVQKRLRGGRRKEAGTLYGHQPFATVTATKAA